jgi:hypothetical protein
MCATQLAYLLRINEGSIFVANLAPPTQLALH